MNHQPGFFDFAAEVGLMKHSGRAAAFAKLFLCRMIQEMTEYYAI